MGKHISLHVSPAQDLFMYHASYICTENYFDQQPDALCYTRLLFLATIKFIGQESKVKPI